MTKKFLSYVSHAFPVQYSIKEAQFITEASAGNEKCRLGIVKDDDGEVFIFSAKENSIGVSENENDYENHGWILPFDGEEQKTIAAQLRELADYLENQ